MKDIKNDFKSFMNDSSSEVPSARALANLRTQLEKEQARPLPVAIKLGLIHLLGSAVSLATCSQFGVRLVGHGEGLMHVFMEISPTFCHSLCGAFYLACTFILARLLMKNEEWYLLLRTRTLSIASLALLSLGTFTLLSHEMTFQAGLLWLFGATLGAELVSLRKLPLRSLWQRT